MSGRLRLAATGVQDQWLTGDPQFSYFLMNFKRHTKFAIDYFENQFDGNIDFDEIITARVPSDKGDLIKNMNLKVTLSDPKPDTPGINDVYWNPSIVANLIEYAELVIGGQVIEKITGEYIYIHQQLHNNNDDTTQTLYFLNGHGNFLTYTGDYTYYLDLPFYFFRNPSLSIPTCALTKQSVEVRIKTTPLSKLIFYGAPSNVSASIRKISLDAEFIYVADEERNFLMSRPIEYAITQLQMSQFKMKAGETKKGVMLNFKHPVRELFFACTPDSFTITANAPNAYTTIKNVELRFNNQVVFDNDTKFLVYEQALKHHTNSPLVLRTLAPLLGLFTLKSDFGMYSFSLHPEVHYPTGQVNMSRIAHKLFTIEIEPSNLTYANDVRVYAVNYNILRFESGLAGLKF
jgi:hypothetical protein